MTTGTQLPPKEFMAKIIAYIEKNPPQTAEEFAAYIRTILAAIPAPAATQKKRFWKRG